MDKGLEMAREDLLKHLEALDLGYEDRSLLVAYLENFIEEVIRSTSTTTERK